MEKVKDSETVANAFKYFILTITESLSLHKIGNEDAISFSKDAFPVQLPGTKIISNTETEVKNIIRSLKSKELLGL
jgi:hypothetical protein